MKKRSIFILIFICILSHGRAQYIVKDSARVKFVIKNGVSNNSNIILDDSVFLIILSSHQRNGDRHEFENGTTPFFKFSAGTTISYTIVSKKYFINKSTMTYNTVAGDNIVDIELTPISKNQLVLKGRVRNEKHNEINLANCSVLIEPVDISDKQGNRKIVTDEMGCFQVIYDNLDQIFGGTFKMTISDNAYEYYSKEIQIKRTEINYQDIQLKPKKKRSLSILLESGGNFLSGENYKSKSPVSIRLEMGKNFKINKTTWNIAAYTDLFSPKFASKSEYVTLPGNEMKIMDNFSLRTAWALALDYIFSPAKRLSYYGGIGVKRMVQNFDKINLDKDLDNPLETKYKTTAPDIRVGVNYKAGRLLNCGAAISASSCKLMQFKYAFNYFGRGTQTSEMANALLVNANINLVINL